MFSFLRDLACAFDYIVKIKEKKQRPTHTHNTDLVQEDEQDEFDVFATLSSLCLIASIVFLVVLRKGPKKKKSIFFCKPPTVRFCPSLGK